jgi:hypothetical protein
VDGTPPMCWGLKTCTEPSKARVALVRGVDVGLGGGRDSWTRIAQDHVGQERGLIRARRCHNEQMFFEQGVPVLGPAEEHRVHARAGDAQRDGWTDPRGAAQGGQAAHRSQTLNRWAKPLPGTAACATGAAGAGHDGQASDGRTRLPTR